MTTTDFVVFCVVLELKTQTTVSKKKIRFQGFTGKLL